MTLIDDINALPVTPADGHTGHLSNHQTIHAALKDHENRLAQNAPLQIRRYTTVGEYVTIGGLVVAGDTGNRSITSLLQTPPNAGNLSIRRVANTVSFSFSNLEFSSGTYSRFDIPTDWGAGVNTSDSIRDLTGAIIGRLRLGFNGVGFVYWDKAGTANCTVDFLNHSPTGWPSTMIGE